MFIYLCFFADRWHYRPTHKWKVEFIPPAKEGFKLWVECIPLPRKGKALSVKKIFSFWLVSYKIGKKNFDGIGLRVCGSIRTMERDIYGVYLGIHCEANSLYVYVYNRSVGRGICGASLCTHTNTSGLYACVSWTIEMGIFGGILRHTF